MVAITLILLVAAIHLWIVVLEMVLWTAPAGRRVFATTEVFASQTKVLAANQGLYNGFLAAGLIWSVLASPPLAASLQLFFLTCVVVAAVYGAATANKAILWKQGGSAIAALLVWLAVHLA